MNKKLLERGIKFFIAAVAIILLDRYAPAQITALRLTTQIVAFALLGFSAYYILKAIWSGPSKGGNESK